MISIRKISKNRNKRKGGIRITNTIESNTIRSMAMNSKYFYDMDYIRFQSDKYSSGFKLDKRDGIGYVRCKDTLRIMEGISIYLHDYEYTATRDGIPALSKYLERRRKS